MRRDTTTLNQNRSGHVWNPKYDKAHEAMPKVGYYQIAWSGLMATRRSYDRTTAEQNSQIRGARPHHNKVIMVSKKHVC